MTSNIQKKPSALKREHPALQHTKLLNFFLLLYVIYALLDPDPDSKYGSGSGSTDPIESGSNTDPDPKPCPHFTPAVLLVLAPTSLAILNRVWFSFAVYLWTMAMSCLFSSVLQ
jgi:hypothetical protein